MVPVIIIISFDENYMLGPYILIYVEAITLLLFYGFRNGI